MNDLVKNEDLNGGVDFREVKGKQEFKQVPIGGMKINLQNVDMSREYKPLNKQSFRREMQNEPFYDNRREKPMSGDEKMHFIEKMVSELHMKYPLAEIMIHQYVRDECYETIMELSWLCQRKKFNFRSKFTQRELADRWKECVYRFFTSAEREIREKAVEFCYR